jgi:hypothetical protein
MRTKYHFFLINIKASILSKGFQKTILYSKTSKTENLPDIRAVTKSAVTMFLPRSIYYPKGLAKPFIKSVSTILSVSESTEQT